MPNHAITIGGRVVGAGHPPLVIAELSGNHNGSLDRALELVQRAAACGAGALKLQTYTAGTLTINSRRPEFFIDSPGSPWHGRRLWELYEEAHTPWEWHEPLFDASRRAGMLCISTAFDESSLELLLRLGADAIKIASFELVHLPLIDAVARSGKPVILSTGMGTREEIGDAVQTLRESTSDFILLKCTSAYPAIEAEANLRTMVDLRDRYQCEVGLSDHTLRPHLAFGAVALGAVVIEKHFTLSRADGGVDSEFSIEPHELTELVDGVGLVWQGLGEVRYGVQEREKASLAERPSIYVVAPVAKGETLTARNVRVIRPGNGLAPKHLPAILGCSARHDIESGTPMSWALIDDASIAPADAGIRENR